MNIASDLQGSHTCGDRANAAPFFGENVSAGLVGGIVAFIADNGEIDEDVEK